MNNNLKIVLFIIGSLLVISILAKGIPEIDYQMNGKQREYVNWKEIAIHQEVELNNYFNCLYKVETTIWINNILGIPIVLDKYYYESGIPYDEVDKVKKQQLIKAKLRFNKLIQALKENRCEQ